MFFNNHIIVTIVMIIDIYICVLLRIKLVVVNGDYDPNPSKGDSKALN